MSDVVDQAGGAVAGLGLLDAHHWELEQSCRSVAVLRGQLLGLRAELAAGRTSTAAVLAQVRT
jgi:hypothetical protein